MCSAWATIRPSASNSAAEQSRRSLMFEEYDARMSSAPISSAMPLRALERTDRVTGSMPLIGLSTSVPVSSTRPRQPGRTTQVASASSTIAGPSSSSPAPSAPRS